MPYTTEDLVKGKSKLNNEPDFDTQPFIKEAEARIDAKLTCLCRVFTENNIQSPVQLIFY